MGDRQKDEEDDGRTAPPSVDTTPAAQPPSPQPSITGAETAHLQDESCLDGFLFSVDWLAFTVPSSTIEEVQQQVGGDWMELEKGFQRLSSCLALSQHGRGQWTHGDGDASPSTRGPRLPLR